MSPTQITLEKEVTLKMDRCIRVPNAQVYESWLKKLMRKEADTVTLDLSGMETINPQTVRLILVLWEMLYRKGKKLRLMGLNENVYDFFRTLKIDRYIRCLR